MQSTFRTVIDEQYLGDPAHSVRWQHTIDFIRRSSFSGTVTAKGLDLGDRTPLTASLEQLFSCTFNNTTADLDVASLEGSFGVVTAFEVLEHLYNPLHALLEVKRLLQGKNARLYLSMPLHKPAFLASPDHFHEMSIGARSLYPGGVQCCQKRGVSYTPPLVLSYRIETAFAGSV